MEAPPRTSHRVLVGLALLAIGLTLLRYFGVSWWSLFDFPLVLVSAAAVVWGTARYRASYRLERRLDVLLAVDAGLTDLA